MPLKEGVTVEPFSALSLRKPSIQMWSNAQMLSASIKSDKSAIEMLNEMSIEIAIS